MALVSVALTDSRENVNEDGSIVVSVEAVLKDDSVLNDSVRNRSTCVELCESVPLAEITSVLVNSSSDGGATEAG